MSACARTGRPSGLLLTTLLLLLLLNGCSQGNDPINGLSPPDQQFVAHSLSDELLQLELKTEPAGTDPAVFGQLKAELRQLLEQKQGSALAPAPPTNDRSTTQLSWDADTATLTWYYFNNGDYDQNGEISVSDLTPLGVHYGKTAGPTPPTVFDQLVSGPGVSPFGVAPVEAVVDGDSNGEIGITDITPLGQNFWRSVSGYRIYAGTEGADYPTENDAPSTLTPLAEITLGEAQGLPGEGRLRFSYTVAAPVAGVTYWVRPFYAGAEGTPSNTAGVGLSYAPGSLALTGISPTRAEPGELIWLQFNSPLADQLEGLTVVVNGITDAEVELADLAIQGTQAGTAAPLLEPGLISIEAFQTGTSIGTVQLNLAVPSTSLTAAETEQEMDLAATEMSNLLTDYIDMLQYTPGYDLAAAQAELADYSAALDGVIEYFLDELNALGPEDQTAVLSYLENSGYFDLLSRLDAHPHSTSRTTSVAYERNWQYLSADMWSAAATNNAYIMDIIGVGSAIVTQGATVPALVAAKVLLAIFDNGIDTYVPTDLYEIRVASQTRMLESGKDLSLIVEGLFAAEKPAISGTLDLFVETALANLKLPASKLYPIRQALFNDLVSKLGGKLVQEFWTAVLPVVDDPESPCDGRIGGWWQRLDLHLYSSVDWDVLADKVLYFDYYHWQDYYYIHGINKPHPERVVTVEPDWIELNFGRQTDFIHFNHPGKYSATIRCFSFNDTQSTWVLWSHTGLREIVLEQPFWVGRYGDWQNTQISHNEVDWGERQYMQLVNGTPVCIYPVWQGYEAIHATSPDATAWSAPVPLLPHAYLKDMAVINGKPVLLFRRDDDYQLLFANDAKGSSWPELGTVIANTHIYSGNHTGSVSNNLLVDDTAAFESTGVQNGYWVELAESGNYAKVYGVLSETEIRTATLPTGDTYSPGSGYTIYRNDVRTSQCRLGATGNVPALIYWPTFTSNMTDTHYVTAIDSSGEAWNEPVLVGQDTGYRTEPIFPGGKPGYAAWYPGQDGVFYRQAGDSAGSTWGSRVLIDAGGISVNTINVISGSPALCFVRQVDLPPGGEVGAVQELYFTMGDSSGSSWQSPVRIGRGMEQVYWTSIGDASLAMIGGVPAVAYSHLNGQPAYIEALDSSGTAWGEPEVILYGNTRSINLCEYNSGPAVCHFALPNDAMFWSVPDL